MLTFVWLLLFEAVIRVFIPSELSEGWLTPEIYGGIVIFILLVFLPIVAIDHFKDRTPFISAVFYMFAMVFYLLSFPRYAELLSGLHGSFTTPHIDNLLAFTFFVIVPASIIGTPIVKAIIKYSHRASG